MVDFKHENQGRQEIYVFKGQYLGFDEEWGTWSSAFFVEDKSVFFCINSTGVMSDLLVFPHRVIPALKYG